MAKNPSVLAFTRSINPGHFLMYSAPEVGGALTPIVVRDEPLRGLNATSKTKEEEKALTVMQVVESANLAAGDTVLVLMGKILIRNACAAPHACNESEFYAQHATIMAAATAAGDFTELAKRYAITLAIGGWAWRNAGEAEAVKVSVTAGTKSFKFIDLLPAEGDMFNVDAPEYAVHKLALVALATELEGALTSTTSRGVNFHVRADIVMGLGARVYPSQEWASSQMDKASKENWKGGNGVTRTLAKIKTPAGLLHAIINDRKVGNALRVIDTWYPGGTAGTPIAVEPYGANAHKGIAYRYTATDSVFGIVKLIVAGTALTPAQRQFYTAVCIRGGVFGGGE
ncbi:MAG: type I-F CRISPR-associated protein Csy3 [Agitococcus sp.]|nr:type I-F CRISPR-associated protein Csy3 [Agitococcus sp.]